VAITTSACTIGMVERKSSSLKSAATTTIGYGYSPGFLRNAGSRLPRRGIIGSSARVAALQ
jgi:hypothetical protein